jgi:hypothetical protein
MKKLIPYLTLILLGIQSCTKNNDGCDTPKDNYYYLTAAQINQTPYFTNPAFDTISYVSDKGDTLTFVKTRTDTIWEREEGQGNPDCGYDQDFYQTIHNTYATIKGIGSFDVKHGSYRSSLFAYLPTDLIVVEFKELDFLVRDFRVGSENGTYFFDKITKGNKIYNNAIKIYHNLKDSTSGESFINKEFGFFSIKNNLTNTEFNYLTK